MEIISKIFTTREIQISRNQSPKNVLANLIWTQVNVISLNMNLSCNNIADKATSVMSRNIDSGIINYVPLY